MSDFTKLTLAAARDGLAKGDFTSRELTEQHLSAMEAGKELNSYIVETPDLALDMADKADERIKAGNATGMTGIPIAMKDLFCTKGVHSCSASHILNGFKPEYESTVSGNLWQDGAVMLGKTNMDEFAMGSSNETSYYGPVKNPWRAEGETKDYVPGGSSGGSVAAVAGHMAIAATGTDTGGSIRQPAAFTGLVGLKPTYGRCSRWGMIAFASSLDQAGPITKTVQDAAIMMESMASYDIKDSTSVERTVPNYEHALTGDIRGMKIGIPKEYRMDGMGEEIEKLWQQGIAWMKAAGAEIVDISLPHTKYALPTYYIVAPAEASSNLARYDGVKYGLRVDGDSLDGMYKNTRAEGFGPEVQRRIMIGTYVLSAGYYDAYYLKAQKIRTLIVQDFVKAYEKVDVILTPTAPSAAFPLGEKMDDPIAMYLNDVFTVPASLAGLPAISVPAGLSKEAMPLGLQIIGQAFDEETVLRAGHVLEHAAGFTAKPKIWWGENS
ncbi:Asp-tRNA(Asn)/Glu-tRNA(Gln) amidotransferase subunit GatA [Paremcibacter congregatus]|uniref:Glutamyl-tRNA(Gln) amidotransferase subunit A n=1 Tax=Paremcibacter congregatus TaxID=2043170 RepID=A0A2G4YNB0_9PROT|nr:Asp-tRNA(Asn)/Glu-tRNA(Gln) amidotransferase subunit GatA [Paremcibacter congregatus]PHZ83798.1 Asp-tRNA(Asn)/Glu-tRNA(Gln) amidotransferase GatCAB subunit A [Paremcibacter congregatus]QDE27501.1 Asp-tRNA(Asn)/Glu-tRNA(Gln) amidotransferase subunit GatA [Paremcibacter congregatus]